MSRAFAYLRRFWAPIGGLALTLAGSLIWALLTKGSLPQFSLAWALFAAHWPWFASGLTAIVIVSIGVELLHRREARRAPLPIRLDPPSTLAAKNGSVFESLVGRERELQQLKDWFAEVMTGRPRIVFVAGEPGIGKTTLMQAFLDSAAGRGARIASGQCVEQYGAGEPYMPVLDALTQLCRGPASDELIDFLHKLAPAWLAQMPTLISAEERHRLQEQTPAANKRMLREMSEALGVIAAETPLILALEDLQWSDPSTIDLLRAIGPRTERARLMILGAHRPLEMLAADHPLRSMKQELELHGFCRELNLPFLRVQDVSAYLAQQPWAAHEFSLQNNAAGDLISQAAAEIHARTDGNPLFVVTFVNYLRERGALRDAASLEAPGNLRQMIERNFDRLEAGEQRVLEAASVAGAGFSAASLAAALDRPLGEIEQRCAELARSRVFLDPAVEVRWPDGTMAAGFRFHHALYREVLYASVPTNQRLNLHRRIAEREESAYGARVAEVAPVLAHHFRCANQPAKAIEYAQLAGDEAIRRSADREAVGHFSAALQVLGSRPAADSAADAQQELILQLKLVTPLIAVKGFPSSEVEAVLARARQLSEKLGDPPEILPGLLWVQWVFYTARGRHREALAWAERYADLAELKHDEGLGLEASHALGVTWLNLGAFSRGLKHLERAISDYDPQRHGHLVFHYGQDTGVVCRSHAAWALWFLGETDKAIQMADEAMAAARKLSQPYTTATVAVLCAWVSQLCGDLDRTIDRAEAAIALSNVEGFPFWAPMGVIMRGWVLLERGEHERGLAEMRRGLNEFRQVGASVTVPYHLALLAQALMTANRYQEASAVLAQAAEIAKQNEETWWDAEIARLRGELALNTANDSASPEFAYEEAERCFGRALTIAQNQGAKPLEVRATTSLNRLKESRDKAELSSRMPAVKGKLSKEDLQSITHLDSERQPARAS